MQLFSLQIQCPFCRQELQVSILTDYLCDHIRQGQCDIQEFQGDELNLYQYQPEDLILILNHVTKIKNLHHLYISKNPEINGMSKLVERIIPKQYVRIQRSFVQQEQTEQAIYNITIPANDDITQLLLQIPFEQIYGSKVIIKLINIPVINDYTEEIDIKQACNLYGLYLNNQELLKAYDQYINFKQVKYQERYNKQIEQQDTQSTQSQGNITNDTYIDLDNIDQDEQNKTTSVFNRIKSTLVNYLKRNDDVKFTQLFSDIYQSIHFIVMRRLSSICSLENIEKIFIALLQDLQTIDDIKITNEMRLEAKKYCFNTFQFPQRQTFPVKRTDSSPKQHFKNIWQVMGINKATYQIQQGTMEASILQYKRIQSDQQIPLQNYDLKQRSLQTARSAKAILLSTRTSPSTICYNYQSQFSQSATHNCHIPYQSLTTSMKDEKMVCLQYNQNRLFVGGRRGVLSFNIAETYQDYIDNHAITDENGNCSFNLPYIYNSQSQVTKLSINQNNVAFLDDMNNIYINYQQILQLPSYCKQIYLEYDNKISLLDYNQFSLYNQDYDTIINQLQIQATCFQNIHKDLYLFGDLYGKTKYFDFRTQNQLIQNIELPCQSPICSFNINKNLITVSQLNGQTSVFDIRNIETPIQYFQNKEMRYKQVQSVCKSFMLSQSKLLTYSTNNLSLFNLKDQKLMNYINLDYLKQYDINQISNMILQDICVINSQSIAIIMNNFNESYLYKIDLNQ